ncbi:restriction endonuclease subunit S [Limosilactobacillus reuteri]|uniref:restriction endonuclease subunit S n=3 Tax=Limosilactobacillus reuteri TaxID=1598 RepID=UPI002B053441|nr:restriction endonuclease subunit S [Limosilactobacillus reuteri]
MDKKPEKLVPEVRFKGFTDDWEQRKLSSIAHQTFGGGTPSKSNKQFWNGDFPWIQSSDLAEDTIRGVHPNKFITQNALQISAAKKIPKNSIAIVSRVGVGKVALIPFNYSTSQDFLSLSGLKINSQFATYSIHKIMKKTASQLQGTSIKGITKKDILNKAIIFPISGKEQVHISSLLKYVDYIISLQQRKLNQLKRLKRAMLQQLFVDKNCKQPILRFKNFNDNWEERKLSDIANYRNGKAHEQYIDMNGIYTVVNSKFISTNGKVKKFSNKPIELLKKGEIAFVLSDVPNGKALAKAYLIDSDNRYSLNQRIAGITPSSDINSYFLYILMNRNRYFLKFDDGVGQTNLSKKDIEEFKENYPLFDEQQKIANLFSKIQILITLQQNKLTQLTTLKKYLLQKLFI